jgi:hypothetical protein
MKDLADCSLCELYDELSSLYDTLLELTPKTENDMRNYSRKKLEIKHFKQVAIDGLFSDREVSSKATALRARIINGRLAIKNYLKAAAACQELQ